MSLQPRNVEKIHPDRKGAARRALGKHIPGAAVVMSYEPVQSAGDRRERDRQRVREIMAEVSAVTGYRTTELADPLRGPMLYPAQVVVARLACAEGVPVREIVEEIGLTAQDVEWGGFADRAHPKQDRIIANVKAARGE